ncbi:Serine/threonine-protein kinase zyg-8 [Caenorhabditis elegans]|uniref:Serine/threonine-protein kinase zyg-8 n=2 Tax=Caenorhabditis elegans TaxID=6239 RepID=DCLK_CAEEL|nr:Serine/threonine-protein kinase zyg-8 [Caenorhabditis elegans]Q95QC4.1 RecName: Full=Serine/threonine-protein kinase zyg-8; AltName: Full=Doublecortin-like and CAM kinase-like protein [Caenorhabditis elegans]CAB54507.2 Serine/threonine-protein kinase zyg-8 [Caenorhabditis elegans]CAC67459.1 ZYG-8 protein [Caenorhabditis elegans]|eukprot:NP_499571.2 Serine/threonine-protein kinase zyg-8 [Caenorhabditis elegans]
MPQTSAWQLNDTTARPPPPPPPPGSEAGGSDGASMNGANTLPRVSKRVSAAGKTSNIPRFKRPHLPHSTRPLSAVLTSSSSPVVHRKISPSSSAPSTSSAHRRFSHLPQQHFHHHIHHNQTAVISEETLTTPRASTLNLNQTSVFPTAISQGSMPNSGTNTAEASMTSSVCAMETEGTNGDELAESRDMVSEMQRRCRIGPSGYPHLLKAKRLRFYRNGDQYFKGIQYALQSDRVKSMQPLMEDLMKTVICDSTALPHGIRHIFTIDGAQRITSVDQFEDGGGYVCSSTDAFKPVDYSRAAEPSWRLTLANRYNRHLETKKLALSVVEPCHENTDFVFPRIIKVIRNGVKPRRISRHLLNKKTARSFDQVLRDLTFVVKLDSGAIRKLFTLSGRPVLSLQDFFRDDDVFVAYGGNEKMAADDLLVASEEHKSVGSGTSSNMRRTSRRSTMPNRNESLRHDRSGSVIPDQDQQRLPPLLDEKFQLVRLIGDGNTAVVYEVIDKTNNDDRKAMKVIARENVIGKEHLIEMELAILQKIDHTFIVQLYDHWFVDDSYYLSLELIEMGDLFEHLRIVRRVPERDAVRMMTCLGQALEYIHELGIVHRDVKLENLLIVKDEFGELGVKLADFGLAAEMPKDFGVLSTICGTPTYVAPEVLNKTGYGCKVDIWAAGVILYAILVGFPPFQSSDGSEQDLFSAIMSGEFSFPSPSWDDVSWSVRHLIMCLIHTDPFHRYSAGELLNDEWMVNLGDVDPEYEEWAHRFVQSKMHVEEEQETPYEYYTSRRTSMDELSESAAVEFSYSCES